MIIRKKCREDTASKNQTNQLAVCPYVRWTHVDVSRTSVRREHTRNGQRAKQIRFTMSSPASSSLVGPRRSGKIKARLASAKLLRHEAEELVQAADTDAPIAGALQVSGISEKLLGLDRPSRSKVSSLLEL